MDIILPYQWAPREYQDVSWNYLTDGGLRLVDNWHRRSGKDDLALRHMSRATNKRVGNYWYLLPEAEQGRKTMWNAINPHTGRRRLDEAFPSQIRHVGSRGTNQQQMLITLLKGSTIQLVGADNFHSLVGSPPVGLVFSEYARTDPSAWAYLMPILEENGGWVIFNSTPYGDNHFKALCDMAAQSPGWCYDRRAADETGVFSAERLQTFLTELQLLYGDEYGYSLWLQEYFCSFDAAIPGSIYGDMLRKADEDGRILDFRFDPTRPVFTAWDIGRTDDTSIWFYQVWGKEPWIVDHHASSLKEVDFYVDEVLLPKQKEHGWTYAKHWLPHDARPRRLGMGGGSILQQLTNHARILPKFGMFDIAPRLDVQEGIQAVRKTMQVARWHRTHCRQGLRSLKHYHRVFDEKSRKFLDHPHHDWSSHDADAFRTLGVVWQRERVRDEDHSPLEERLLRRSINCLTYGELTKQHFAARRRKRSESKWKT